MKRVAIVQARLGSTRLPGKVLELLSGRPMLAQVLRRVQRMQQVDEVVVATTDRPEDDPVAAAAGREGARWFRGDEKDVLGRYLGAAREAGADLVVRITADCPLLDPGESDRVVADLVAHQGEADYAGNVSPRTYPTGLDTEALYRDALERTARLGRSAAAREHVTWFLRAERPDLFLVRSVTDVEDHSELRWTVDTAEDLAMVRRVYQELDLDARPRAYREVLAWMHAHPEVAGINRHVRPKAIAGQLQP